MKSFQTFCLEQSNTVITESVDSQLMRIINNAMAKVDYSRLSASASEQDASRFKAQKQNEQYIASLIDSEYDALTTAEYYQQIKGKDFNNLSLADMARFDRENGDIIITKNADVLYNIDVKISNSFLGSINLGSISDFDKDGYYLLINLKKRTYKVVSHKAVVDLIEANPNLLQAPVRGYKGFAVNWNGENLSSEYFVKGLDLQSLIN